jgi:hypothetical protein
MPPGEPEDDKLQYSSLLARSMWLKNNYIACFITILGIEVLLTAGAQSTWRNQRVSYRRNEFWPLKTYDGPEEYIEFQAEALDGTRPSVERVAGFPTLVDDPVFVRLTVTIRWSDIISSNATKKAPPTATSEIRKRLSCRQEERDSKATSSHE